MSITALPRPVVGAPTDLLRAAVPGTGGDDFAALLAAMVAGPTPDSAAGPAATDQATDETDATDATDLDDHGVATSAVSAPLLLVQEWASVTTEFPVTVQPASSAAGGAELQGSGPAAGDPATASTLPSPAPRNQPGAASTSPLPAAPLDDPTPSTTPADALTSTPGTPPAAAPPAAAPPAAPAAPPAAAPPATPQLTRPDLATQTDPPPSRQTELTPAPVGVATPGAATGTGTGTAAGNGTTGGVPVSAFTGAVTTAGARPPELHEVSSPVATPRPGADDGEHPTLGDLVLRPLTGPLAALFTGTTSDPGSGNDDQGAVADQRAADIDSGAVPAAGPRLDVAVPTTRLDPTTPGVVAGPAAREIVAHVDQLASQGGGTRQVTLRLETGSMAEVRVHLSLSDGTLRVRIIAGDRHAETLQLGAAGLQALLRDTGVDDVRVEVSGTATTADQPGGDHGSEQSTPQDSSRADSPGSEWSGPRSGRERTPTGTWDVTSAMDGTQARALRPRPVEPSSSSPRSGVDVLA